MLSITLCDSLLPFLAYQTSVSHPTYWCSRGRYGPPSPRYRKRRAGRGRGCGSVPIAAALILRNLEEVLDLFAGVMPADLQLHERPSRVTWIVERTWALINRGENAGRHTASRMSTLRRRANFRSGHILSK
jgi:hypothetical protein